MKKLIITLAAVFFLHGIATADGHLIEQELATVSDFKGTYSGVYTGTDDGTWTVRCDSSGSLIGISWSQIYGMADAGSGSVTSSGEFTSNMVGGAILRGNVAADGTVQGTWTNSYTSQGGTLQGEKNLPNELAVYVGRYSGTYAGSDYGTWDVVLDSLGYGSGTIQSGKYGETYSGYGIINASGEIMAVVSNGSVLHGAIDSSFNVSGMWNHPSSGSGSISGSKLLVPPAAPVIKISISGITVSINWNSIPDAVGYTLYYAPPDISYIQSIALGTRCYFSCALWEGASFYVAVQAYNSYGSSGYSNIELIEVPTEEPSTPGPVVNLEIDSSGIYSNTLTWTNPTGSALSSIEVYVAYVKPGIPFWESDTNCYLNDLFRYSDGYVYKFIKDGPVSRIPPDDAVYGYGGTGERHWNRMAYPYRKINKAYPKALIPAKPEEAGSWTHNLSGTDLAVDWYYWVRAMDKSGNRSNWRPKEYMEGLFAPAKIYNSGIGNKSIEP